MAAEGSFARLATTETEASGLEGRRETLLSPRMMLSKGFDSPSASDVGPADLARVSPRAGTTSPPVLGRSHSTDSLIAETLERTTAAASPRKLNMLQLVMITYFSVSGGPFGLESIVGEAGPRISLLGLCVIPWVWALPQALMTAELATAIPEMGGYVVWVHRAFGEAAGFQVGVWKTVESLLDLALYPVLLVSYAEAFLQWEMSSVMRWLVSAAILAAVALINVLGAEMVGDYSTAFGVVVLLPFLILVLVGLKDISFDAMLAGSAPPAAGEEAEPIDWGIFFAILLWNTSGFDSAGTCAGEVAEPARVYLPAMVTTLCLTVLTYLLPVAVGVSVTAGAAGGFDAWRTGHFVEVGRLVGGPWLAGWIAAAGAVSALALLTSLLCTSSRALAALAELGMAPAALGRIHPTHGTPHVAVLANAVLTSCLVLLDFEVIAEMAMCLYCLAMLFELLSLAHLRTVEPALPRPYRIPVSDTWGIRMFVAPPCLLCLGLVANSGPQPAALGVCVVGATALVHVCWRRRCTPSLVRARDQLRRVRERGPYATLRGVMGVTEGERDAEVEALVPQPDGLTGR